MFPKRRRQKLIRILLLGVVAHMLQIPTATAGDIDGVIHMAAQHNDNGIEPRSTINHLQQQLLPLSHSNRSRRGNMSSQQCEELSGNLCSTCRTSYRSSARTGKCTSKKQCKRSFSACQKRARKQFNSKCSHVMVSKRVGRGRRRRRRRPRGRNDASNRSLEGNGGKGKGSSRSSRQYPNPWRQFPMQYTCRAPTNVQLQPRGQCGDFTPFNFGFLIDIETYCGTEVDGTPGLQLEERSAMEDALLNYFNKEADCFEPDPCERIEFQAVAIVDFDPAEICAELDATEAGRRLQRRKGSKAKGNGKARCRSRKKKCRKSGKDRRLLLEISYDDEGGFVVREEKNVGGAETSTATRNLLRSRNRQDNGQIAERDLQQCADEVDLGQEMRATGYEGFRDIETAIVEEVDPTNKCSPGQVACDVDSTCCGQHPDCRCLSASESYCAVGTVGVGRCQLYDDRRDNLCCALNPFPPLSFLYPNCDCGRLPTPRCEDQDWIEPASESEEGGSFQITAEVRIIQLCGDRFEIKRALERVVKQYFDELVQFSGCENFISASNNGVHISRVQLPDSCQGDSTNGVGESQQQGECTELATGKRLGSTTALVTIAGTYEGGLRPISLPLESLDLGRRLSLLTEAEQDMVERFLQGSDCECTTFICILLKRILADSGLSENIKTANVETETVRTIEDDPSRLCAPFGTACGVGDVCCSHPSIAAQLTCNPEPNNSDGPLCCIIEGEECGTEDCDDPPWTTLINGGCCDTACNKVGNRHICCNDVECSQYL